MKNHTLDFDDHPYPGLNKIQTLILMKHHTLDLDEISYSGLDKIQTLILMKHHTLDLDEKSYPGLDEKTYPRFDGDLFNQKKNKVFSGVDKDPFNPDDINFYFI